MPTCGLSNCCGGNKKTDNPYAPTPKPNPDDPESGGGGGGGGGGHGVNGPTPIPGESPWGFDMAITPLSGNKGYDELREELRKTGSLFKDPDFPPSSRILGPDVSSNRYVTWLRPTEIVRSPKFIRSAATRFDLDQGSIGDCWFVSAAATLAVANPRLFQRTVPHEQTFSDGYCGIFKFHFWRFNGFVEVVVDDRLPVMGGQLVYARNREEPDEFWVALLEKAYAKMYGGYTYIDGGFARDAMVDFTGGISEGIDLSKTSRIPANMYELLERTCAMNSMLAASIRSRGIREEALANGLFRQHAYSITKLSRVKLSGREYKLVRLRNPWGRSEWNGKWNDNSTEWKSLDQKTRDDLDFVKREDGEFWMSYDDFTSNFEDLEMCHLFPDAMTLEIAQDTKKKSWNAVLFESEWVAGLNAGGCGNPPYQSLYWKNPQFRMTLSVADDDDKDGRCTAVISLLQKGAERGFKISTGYTIFKLRDSAIPRNEYDNYTSSDLKRVDDSGTYINLRERTGRHLLTPGHYIIVPSSFEPNQESQFLLRIYSEKKAEAAAVDEDTTYVSPEREADAVAALFNKYAADDGTMDADDLRAALNERIRKEYGVTDDFGVERSRALVAMMDPENHGVLTLTEFRQLLKDVSKWQMAFAACDKDRSGWVDTYELTTLFKAVGFTVSSKVLGTVVRRYGGRKHRLTLADFMCLAAKLIAMYNIFKRNSKHGSIMMSLDQWMASTLSF